MTRTSFSQAFESALVFASHIHSAQVRKGKEKGRAIPYVGHLLAVTACSDTFKKPKPAWRKRKRDYVRRLPESTSSALLVSCADKLANARSILEDIRPLRTRTLRLAEFRKFIGDEPEISIKKRTGLVLGYYRACANAFREHGVAPRLVAELHATLDTLEALTKVKGDVSALK